MHNYYYEYHTIVINELIVILLITCANITVLRRALLYVVTCEEPHMLGFYWAIKLYLNCIK
jgi:hypothetical protein